MRTRRAVAMRTTLKQLLRSYVEQGLNTPPPKAPFERSAGTLPRIKGALSNAVLFELLDA
jgi:hypothetical protein